MPESHNSDNALCRDHDKRVTGIEHKIETSKEAMGDVKKLLNAMSGKIDQLLEKVARVELLEQRHNNHQAEIERAHNEIKDAKEDHTELAKEVRAFMNFAKGMGFLLYAVCGAIAVLMVKVLFFTASKGMTL